MKYVLLILYSAMSANGWGTTRLHQEFDSMKECRRALATWQQSLGTKYISGQCYYRGNAPLRSDCKAWGEYSRKWTSYCSEKGNEITRRCVQLEMPPPPYDQCQ